MKKAIVDKIEKVGKGFNVYVSTGGTKRLALEDKLSVSCKTGDLVEISEENNKLYIERILGYENINGKDSSRKKILK